MYRRRRRRGLTTWAGFAAIAAVAVVVLILVVMHSGGLPSGHTNPTPSAKNNCAPSGCAVVSLSRSLPPLTVFYGASCSGPRGVWFFNAVEGGGNDQLRPSYQLRWTFATGSAAAAPSGNVVISPTSTTDVTITLNAGTLTIKGTRKPSTHVSASGTLQVQLTGTSGAPTLTFTETGLTKAESDLGLVSPFDAGGQPLVVPITTVKTMTGC